MKSINIPFITVILCFITSCKNNDQEPAPENQNPSAVILITPEPGAANISPLSTFQWSAANDPDGDEVTYELYNGTEDDPDQLVYAGPATSFTPDERLSLHEQYKWKVVAKDNKNGASESEINSFKTRSALVSQKTSDTKLKPRINASCVSFANKLWLIGGSLDNFGLDRISEVWSSSDGNTWTLTAKDAPFKGRNAHASTVFKRKMWVIGGATADGLMNDVWSSGDGKNWELVTATAGFPKVFFHTITVFDNKMWVMGGLTDSDANNDVWYSEDGATWKLATKSLWDDPPALGSYVPLTFNDKLWIIGGVGAWSSSDGIQWKEEASAEDIPAFVSRRFHVCIVYDNKIWLISGSNQEGQRSNDIWYSKDGISWIEVTSSAAFPERVFASSAVLDDKLWIVGGAAETDILNDVWFID